MKKLLLRTNLLLLIAVFPTIYGCGGGSGIGELTSLLFGSGGAGFGGTLPPGLGGGIGGGGGIIPTLTNPEPTTMLLMGSGMIAMGYFKAKKNKQ